MPKYEGEEKRQHLRLKATYVVSYKTKESSDHYNISQTQNVSQGGAIITTDKKFEPGIVLDLTLKLSFLGDKLNVSAEVVESKEKVKGSIYETRVKFINLSQEQFDKIGEFIKLKGGR